MSSFTDEYGDLTVAEALALNEAAKNSMGDPSIG